MNEPIRFTSLANLGEFFQAHPMINRLILKKAGESNWEIIRQDGERPNDLRDIAERSSGRFSYERNLKRGFEAISGYTIDNDEQHKVVYRLGRDGVIAN